MRNTVGLILIFALLTCLPLPAKDLRKQVTARLHVFARVPPDVIVEAQRFVRSVYASAGVSLRWAPSLRHADGSRKDPCGCPSEDVSILLLSERMTERYSVHRDVMGVAPIAAEGGGRIAYVFYDRVEGAAPGERSVTLNLLGLVIAHEIGHLLLPRGAHAPTGLMRERWHINELRTINPETLRFAPEQAAHLQTLLTVDLRTPPLAP